MQPPTVPSNLEQQNHGLSVMIQLQQKAREAVSIAALGFIVTNETHALVPYDQAVLFRLSKRRQAVVQTLSGVALPDQNSPYCVWLEQTFVALSDHIPKKITTFPFDSTLLPLKEQPQWSEWLPQHALWAPLSSPDHATSAVLWLARTQPWDASQQQLLAHLAGAYGHAWHALIAQQRGFMPNWQRSSLSQRAFKVLLPVVALAACWLPVRQSVLAPAQVIASKPALVRATTKGIIDRVLVQPNQLVKAGQPLVAMDNTVIDGRLAVENKVLSVVKARYRQAAQQAVFDSQSKTELAILRGRFEQQIATLDYMAALVKRGSITAHQDGIVVFNDALRLQGQPVDVGERIMYIADPDAVELEIFLGVADAIALESGTDVILFLDAEPHLAIPLSLYFASYEAEVTPQGILAYRLKASFADGVKPPRIGLHGTAKIMGKQVTLFYYLFRRPLATLRRQFGVGL